MKWFIPSWNGDLRLEVDPKDAGRTILSIVKPTPQEVLVVNEIGKAFEAMGWLGGVWETYEKKRFARNKSFTVNAPLEKTGPIATALMRPGRQVLTAIAFKGGHVETVSMDQPDATAALAQLSEKAAAAPAEKPAEAAATVKRHTPSCPACIPGAIEPATECLLAFLSEEEHDQWARERAIIVTGGLSGSRYRLSHRNTRYAQRAGRMCVDLDSRSVVHFHDWTVPPEEEVLAAKLILEHREHWLRNEATMLGSRRPISLVFKNPFGGVSDGIPDAIFTRTIGHLGDSALASYAITKALLPLLLS